MKSDTVFQPINKRYNPDSYLGALCSCGYSIVSFEKLKPGTEAVFKLESDRAFTLHYLGEKPEKAVIENNELRVIMPDALCFIALQYDYVPKKVLVVNSF